MLIRTVMTMVMKRKDSSDSFFTRIERNKLVNSEDFIVMFLYWTCVIQFNRRMSTDKKSKKERK